MDEQVQCTNFASCIFNDVVIINTHGVGTGKTFHDNPCGIVFGTRPGKTFKTILADDGEFYNPAFWGVIQNTKIISGETNTGGEILEKMCSVREVPGAPSKDKSISAECTFTGYPANSSNIPNMRLFLPGGEALVREGIWRYKSNSNGIFKMEDVSNEFGLEPSSILHQFTSKVKPSSANDEIKKKVLEEIAQGRLELENMSKNPGYEVDPKYISNKQRLDIISEAIKNYMFSFETGEVVPAEYVLTKRHSGGNKEEGVLLDKLLETAVEEGTITPQTVVIVLACFGSIDPETAYIIKEFIENNTSILSKGGGTYNKKYKIRKSRKYRYINSRKHVRYIRRKKIKKSKKIKYKK
jgi:hypothetical protein